MHLQILRAIAASLVVVNHVFPSLAVKRIDYGDYTHSGDFMGSIGVCAFFVLSGLIMVRQSADRFGAPRSPYIFLYHRILRIVPLYWIATLLWFNSLRIWHVPTIHAKAQLLCSLFFIPDWYSAHFRLNPVLGQGWTLNYEMSFYLLFAIALFFPRRIGIAILLAVPLILIREGQLHHGPISQSAVSLWGFYTNSIILLFAYGVLIGFLELRLKRIPKFDIPVSPAWLLILPAVLFLSGLAKPEAVSIWEHFRIPFCVGIVALCTLVVNARMGWFNRMLALLGDASYSTYLFHLWIYNYSIPPVLFLYTRLHRTPHSPVPFIVASVVAANLAGLIIHLILERPLTRVLKNIRLKSIRAA